MRRDPSSLPQRRVVLWSLPVLLLLWAVLGVHTYGVLAATVVGLLASGHYLARRGLRDLSATRQVSTSAFEGDTVDIELKIENQGRRATRYLEVSHRFGPSIVDRQLIPEAGPVPGRTRRRLHYSAMCSRRWGIHKVGPIAISAVDPLGLFESTRGFPEVESFALFPQVYDLEFLEPSFGRLTLDPRDSTTDRVGQSQRYLGVRDYRSGDELRRIHWPATARRGELTVKEFESDVVPYFSLFLDLERAHRAGTGRKSTLEFVVRSGASLLWTAVRRRQLFQVMADDGDVVDVPPGQGGDHLALALHRLIQVLQEGQVPLLEVVRRNLVRIPVGSSVGLVFASQTPEMADLREVVDLLRSRRVALFVLVIAGHTFAAMEHWRLPAEEIEERWAELESFLATEGIPTLTLDSESSLAEVFERGEEPRVTFVHTLLVFVLSLHGAVHAFETCGTTLPLPLALGLALAAVAGAQLYPRLALFGDSRTAPKIIVAVAMLYGVNVLITLFVLLLGKLPSLTEAAERLVFFQMAFLLLAGIERGYRGALINVLALVSLGITSGGLVATTAAMGFSSLMILWLLVDQCVRAGAPLTSIGGLALRYIGSVALFQGLTFAAFPPPAFTGPRTMVPVETADLTDATLQALIVAAVVAAGLYLLRHRLGSLPEDELEELDTIDELRSEADEAMAARRSTPSLTPGRVRVVETYGRFLADLEHRGFRRRRDWTPRELQRRLPSRASESAGELTRLFERARYGPHDMGEAEHEAAATAARKTLASFD